MSSFKRIYLEIINYCNLSCPFCSPPTLPPRMMDTDAILDILPRLKKYTDHLFLHLKGEPLLHPELSTILDSCYHHALQVNLTTNGTLLAQNHDMLLQKPALRQINISLHSLLSQPPTTHATYMESVLAFAKAAANYYYVSLRLWNKIHNDYDASSKQILQYLLQYFHAPYSIADITPTQSNMTLAPHIFLSFENQFQWPALHQPFRSSKGTCYGLRTQLGILADGTVVPCCLDGDGINKLGNIFHTPLEKILTDSPANTLLEGFLKHQLIAPLCQRCQFRTRFN